MSDSLHDFSLPGEALLAAMEDGVCVQTPDGRIVRVNEAFAIMFGKPAAEIIGQTCAEVFGCAQQTGHGPEFCARLTSLNTGQIANEEICVGNPEQRLRARVSPVKDETGTIVAFVMVVRDVTDVIARERELGRIEQKTRFGELVAGLAHEIKNPLAGIQGAVDILIQRRDPNDPEREVLENVRHEASRINTTIQSLVTRAHPREFKFQPASLTDAVQRATTLGQHRVGQGGHSIKVEFIADAAPVVMNIDAAQIEEAISNLITNAIEAINGHGVVTINLQHSADEVIITIKDNGRGIAQEDLQRIFSPFFTTHKKGTGLGLAAVRRIVRAHGGRVEVDSEVGNGATFTLRLPRER